MVATTVEARARQEDLQPAAESQDGGSLTGEFPRVLGINTILIVDDDHGLRRPIARILRARGVDVREAADGAEARAEAERHRPDLILCDLHLPDCNGEDLVQAWKRIDPTRPIIVLTGTEDEDERIRAFDAGADDLVGKPVCMRELTKRIEVHDRILRSSAALQSALRQADNMRMFAAEAAALLAHDLNNGLCVAASNLAYLGDVDPVTSDPDLLDAVQTSQKALRRMTTLVRNFVDVARSEDGELKPQRIVTDVREILRASAAIHHPRGAPEDRGIELDCPERLEASIDPTLLERVVHNLLINATRYVDHGGRVRVTARRVLGARGWELLIQIGNTGAGIPAHLRPGLFEKYGKGGDRKAQTGMGLYFCRLACEAHGGTIALVEHPVFATTFEMRLPVGELPE